MIRSIVCGIVVLLAVLLGPMMPRVEAEQLRSFKFLGTVDSVTGRPFGLTVNHGDSISGSLTYDAEAPGIAYSATLFSYPQSIIFGIAVLVAGRTYSSNNFTVLVENNRPTDMVDGYNADSNPGFNPRGDLFENGTRVSGTISVNALDFTGTLLSSPSLLDLVPTLFNSRLELVQDNSNYLKASIAFAAPTPQAAVELLRGRVQVLLGVGFLTPDQAHGLMDKLEAVIANLNRNGPVQAACNQLQAFISQVMAFTRTGKLPLREGQKLIDAAEAVRDQIGC